MYICTVVMRKNGFNYFFQYFLGLEIAVLKFHAFSVGFKLTEPIVVYQGPNQTNQDSIKAWLKHEEPNSTRQQQEVINQTLAPARLNTPCNIKTKGSG